MKQNWEINAYFLAQCLLYNCTLFSIRSVLRENIPAISLQVVGDNGPLQIGWKDFYMFLPQSCSFLTILWFCYTLLSSAYSVASSRLLAGFPHLFFFCIHHAQCVLISPILLSSLYPQIFQLYLPHCN